MAKKLIKLLTLVLLLSASSQVFANGEFELFDQLKEDMWNMGLDFEYVHTQDLKIPNQQAISDAQAPVEVGPQEQSLVKSVPYELIMRYERVF